MTKHQLFALTFSFLYVGLGTFWIFTSFGADRLFIDWPLPIIITLPVTVISFAIRSGVEDYFAAVTIIQIIMFALTYLLTLKIVRRFSNATR
jgi:hypothetical protein